MKEEVIQLELNKIFNVDLDLGLGIDNENINFTNIAKENNSDNIEEFDTIWIADSAAAIVSVVTVR
jgi:hypothetical protein